MKVGEILEAFKGLDPEEDAIPWLKAYSGNKEFKELTIARAGAALKSIIPILGKPFLTQNADGGGKPIRWRIIMWKGLETNFFLASKALAAQGINEFEITDSSGYFKIRLPRLAQFRDFNSDDPAVWEKNYQKRQAEDAAQRLWEQQADERRQAESDAYMAHWNSPEGIAEREAQNAVYAARKEEEKIKIFDEVKEKLLAKQKAAIVVKKDSARAIELGHD